MSLIQFCVIFVFFVTAVMSTDLIYYSPIKHVTEDTFIGKVVKDVHFLDFRGCSIETISHTAFDDITNLSNLLLTNNDIETLPDGVFNKLKNIEAIRMKGNKLKHISDKIFSNLNKLNMIDISSNAISTIEIGAFDNDVKLQSIYLSCNRLTVIPIGIFNTLKELNHLDLGDNLIYNIEDSALPNFHKLRTLMIFSNKLQHLNKNFVELLTTSSLDKNPWVCDCKLKEVHAKWKKTFQNQGWTPVCNAPENLYNVRWDKLTSDDFVCPPTDLHIYPEHHDITAEVGGSISLDCYVMGPAKASEIMWTYNNNKEIINILKDTGRSFTVQFNSVKKNKISTGVWYNITIYEVKSSDDGVYKCIAKQENEMSEVEKRVLVVNGKDLYKMFN